MQHNKYCFRKYFGNGFMQGWMKCTSFLVEFEYEYCKICVVVDIVVLVVRVECVCLVVSYA